MHPLSRRVYDALAVAVAPAPAPATALRRAVRRSARDTSAAIADLLARGLVRAVPGHRRGAVAYEVAGPWSDATAPAPPPPRSPTVADHARRIERAATRATRAVDELARVLREAGVTRA